MKDDARAGIGARYLARAFRRMARLQTGTIILTEEDQNELDRITADITRAEEIVGPIDGGFVRAYDLEGEPLP